MRGEKFQNLALAVYLSPHIFRPTFFDSKHCARFGMSCREPLHFGSWLVQQAVPANFLPSEAIWKHRDTEDTETKRPQTSSSLCDLCVSVF